MCASSRPQFPVLSQRPMKRSSLIAAVQHIFDGSPLEVHLYSSAAHHRDYDGYWTVDGSHYSLGICTSNFYPLFPSVGGTVLAIYHNPSHLFLIGHRSFRAFLQQQHIAFSPFNRPLPGTFVTAMGHSNAFYYTMSMEMLLDLNPVVVCGSYVRTFKECPHIIKVKGKHQSTAQIALIIEADGTIKKGDII